MTLKEIEQAIRRQRQIAFDGTEQDQEAVQVELLRLKSLAAPFWNERAAAVESRYARVMWM